MKEICTTVGPGAPFTKKEKERAESLRVHIAKYADFVEVEEFSSTNAYLGWFRPGCIVGLISVILYFISNFIIPIILIIISFILGLLLFLTLLLEFILSIEFIDPLFKKKKSQNVVGHIKPKSDSKDLNKVSDESIDRIIIFSGHHDTSPEFNLLKYFKKGYYIGIVVIFITVLGIMIAPLLKLIVLSFDIVESWSFQSYLIFTLTIVPVGLLIGYFFYEEIKGDSGGSVPGAIDNLTSSSIALVIAKLLAENQEYIPKGTEIRCISFGAEEANMKGAWAYAKAHLNELKSKNAYLINFESIADSEIAILTSDNNGFTKNSMELVNKVEMAAKKAEVPYRVEPFPFGGGGTDAFGFSRFNLHATSLFSLKVPDQMIEFYHQASDNYDKVNRDAIENVLKICFQFLEDFK